MIRSERSVRQASTERIVPFLVKIHRQDHRPQTDFSDLAMKKALAISAGTILFLSSSCHLYALNRFALVEEAVFQELSDYRVISKTMHGGHLAFADSS